MIERLLDRLIPEAFCAFIRCKCIVGNAGERNKGFVFPAECEDKRTDQIGGGLVVCAGQKAVLID